MSIELVRIDNRLIHGQVVEAWVPYLKADRIIVVDDDTAGDPLKRSILELATPADIRLDIVSIKEMAQLYAENAFEKSHVMVLFAGPCQAYNAFKAGFSFQTLNVGNVHFAQGKTRMSSSVCVDQEEMTVLRELARNGVVIELRTVPREPGRALPDGGTNASGIS
jgi:PTS system mannose-specific IIB component